MRSNKLLFIYRAKPCFFQLFPFQFSIVHLRKPATPVPKRVLKKKNGVKPSSDLQFRHIPPTANASLTHRNSCRFTGSLRHAKTAGLCEVTHACFQFLSAPRCAIKYHRDLEISSIILYFFFSLHVINCETLWRTSLLHFRFHHQKRPNFVNISNWKIKQTRMPNLTRLPPMLTQSAGCVLCR